TRRRPTPLGVGRGPGVGRSARHRPGARGAVARRDSAVRRARPDRRPGPGAGGSPPRGAGAPPFFRRTRRRGHTRHGRVLVGGDTVVGRRRGGGPRRVAEGPSPTAWPGEGLSQAESGSASQRRRPGTHARRPHGSPAVVVAGAVR